MDNRAYTWCCVTYATEEEYEPLLLASKHYALAKHDKDFVIADDGSITPKETHTHIIVTFERAMSFNQVRSFVQSEQNTLAQPCQSKDRNNNDVVRGAYRYLLHLDEDESIKYRYDISYLRTDDDAYWERRCKEELDTMTAKDSFMDDLLADNFSVVSMGRKYGRDFMKNFGRYTEFRRACLEEQRRVEALNALESIAEFCAKNNIPLEELNAFKPQIEANVKHHFKQKGYYHD